MPSMTFTKKQRKMAKQHLPLLRRFLYSKRVEFIGRREDWEEFRGLAFLKYCYAIRRFKPETGFKPSTFIYGAFAFAVKEFNDSRVRLHRMPTVTLENAVDFESNSTFNVDSDSLFGLIDKAKLDEREKMVLLSYFIHSVSCEELGKILRLSKQRVNKLINRGLNKIREYAGTRGLMCEDFVVT